MFSMSRAVGFFIDAASDVATGEKSFDEVDRETRRLISRGEMTTAQADKAIKEAKRAFTR
jgi:phage terminase Nu1 subunit (DNA packaging protein)